MKLFSHDLAVPRRALLAHAVLLLTTFGFTSEGRSASLPVVPGFNVSVYANVDDPITLAFAPDGRLFIGRDNTGSGGGNADPLKIHVVAPLGGNANEYGDTTIVDPDAIGFDATGLISGVAGSVLVGGVAVPTSGTQGAIHAIHPDETVVTLFGPTSTFINPQTLAFDGSGRLLFTDFNAAKVFASNGGPITPLFNESVGLRDLAIATDGRIFTRNANSHVIQIHAADGSLLNANFASSIDGNGLAFGPGGAWGTSLYAMDGNALVSLDSQGNATVRGTGFGTSVQDIVFGPSGALYVSDFENDRILRIAPAGLGPVAHYPLDGNGLDVSGNGRHGTVFGATPTSDRHGAAGGAMAFDGVDDWIRAQGDGLPSGERTVALWFRANQFENHPVLLGYGGHFCGDSWFMGANATNYGPGLYVSGHCGVGTLIDPSGNPPIATWIHWAVTTDPTGTRIYVNGVESTSDGSFIDNTWTLGTDLAMAVDVSPQGLGPYVDSNVSYWDGALDDVRIYDRALTAAEIASLADVTTAVASSRALELGLDAVSPNPIAGRFRVEFRVSAEGPVVLDLLDLAGRRLQTMTLRRPATGSNSIVIDPIVHRPGVYWIRLTQAGRSVSRRIVALN